MLLALAALLFLGGVGLLPLALKAYNRRELRDRFLSLAAARGIDTVLITDFSMEDSSVRALDFVRSRSALIYRVEHPDLISLVAASPTSPLCAFLSGREDTGDLVFDSVTFLDLESLRVEANLSLPAGVYAYSQYPAWSHDGRHLAIACTSNQTEPEIVVIRVDASGNEIERRVTIPREVARQQPFVVWSEDPSMVTVSLGGDGESISSLMLDMVTGGIQPAPYRGQVRDASRGGRLLVWVPNEGFMLGNPDGEVPTPVG